jgi:tetraacyldisaccharide 4'-kinase
LASGVLFVTNGHGEAAIAAKIAEEARALGVARTEHFALVGERLGGADFADVGPQRAMPSGGLVAMGNVRAFARDLGAGFAGLLVRQLRFLRAVRGRYAAVVAVGDAYACALALLARTPLVYVGTAKSVYVAPYGPGERRIVRAARRIFVRDAATAADLRAHGVEAEAPGNVIVDLIATGERIDWRAPLRLALLPGSRERAYADAMRIAAVVAALRERAPLDAVLSIAPNLEPERFAPALELGGLRPWTGPLGALLHGATLVIGQSGTANEAAAAEGLPVVALELDDAPRDAWYRKRQVGLLGDALQIVPGEPRAAAGAIAALLADDVRRAQMGAVGRERMGGPGGARAIAQALAALADAA